MFSWQTITDHDVDASQDETARAIYELAAQVGCVAHALRALGNAEAATPMGALEAFGKHLGEKLDNLTRAIGNAEGPPACAAVLMSSASREHDR